MARVVLYRLSVLFLFSFATAARAADYSMADLEALQKSKSWHELVEHLDDIPPSGRKESWQKIVTETATELLRSERSLTLIRGLIERYTFLSSSDAFKSAMKDTAPEAVAKCFEQNYDAEQCLKSATKIAGTLDAKTAYGIASAVKKAQFPYVAAPIFQIAVELDGGKLFCDETPLQESTFAGLELPKDEPAAVASAKVLAGVCWDAMNEQALIRLRRSARGSYYTVNVCPVVAKHIETAGLPCEGSH